jgi:hypothetical protein
MLIRKSKIFLINVQKRNSWAGIATLAFLLLPGKRVGRALGLENSIQAARHIGLVGSSRRAEDFTVRLLEHAVRALDCGPDGVGSGCARGI